MSLIAVLTACGAYEAPETGGEDEGASTVACEKNCIPQTQSNLMLKAHLGGNGAEFSVNSTMSEWNIAGECNEGGFLKNNRIRWELYLGTAFKRHSGMAGTGGGSAIADSICVNGRFLIYVNMRAITDDPVDRTGLRTGAGTARSNYDLYIEIMGEDFPNDSTPYKNPSKGRFKVSLLQVGS